VIGWELIVGWLAAWLWGKARRAAGRCDAGVNRAIDAGMDRLHELVSAKLGDDPALARLAEEAAQNLDTASTSVRTRQRVQLALEEAADSDPRFAAQLAEVVADLAKVRMPSVSVVTVTDTGPATVIGDGVAITGAVNGDVSIGMR
jgi:isopropylmalate/homocitrate/citramalate synthase